MLAALGAVLAVGSGTPVLECMGLRGPAGPQHCLVFADRWSIGFRMVYTPPKADDPSPAAIGAGWGTDFDDVARPENGGRIVIRNGAGGEVDTYGADKRGGPLRVMGGSADQRQRRQEGCEVVEREALTGLRREYCDRTIQHFDETGRLIRYSTHAFRQVFELNWGEDGLRAVTGYDPAGRPLRIDFKREPGTLTVTDQDRRSVTLRFDTAGRMVRAESSAGEVYTYRYTSGGRLIPTGGGVYGNP